EQGVGHRVQDDIGIGMPQQPARVLDPDSPQDQGPPFLQPMRIVTDPHPHSSPRSPLPRPTSALTQPDPQPPTLGADPGKIVTLSRRLDHPSAPLGWALVRVVRGRSGPASPKPKKAIHKATRRNP